jgi:hypothetical protein
MISMTTHKEISRIETIDDLKKIFPNGECNMCNVVLFSTSGVHGTYLELEVLEECLELFKEGDDDYADHLTVLVIQPRVVSLRYGHIKITLEDIPYLKQLRESSKKAILKYF